MNHLPRQATSRSAQGVALLVLAVLLCACGTLQVSAKPALTVAGGDSERGKLAIQHYGCGSCHKIPGIAGADTWVGPPLINWAEREYIAGTFPNQPQFLIEWIRYPQAIEPGSAMPNLGVTEQEARDIGAYLYTLTGD
jgi:cytochrome c2